MTTGKPPKHQGIGYWISHDTPLQVEYYAANEKDS